MMQLMMSRAFAAQHSGSDEQDAMMCCMCCVHRLDRSIRFMISMSVRDRCRDAESCREVTTRASESGAGTIATHIYSSTSIE
jgi:hypothetical protein